MARTAKETAKTKKATTQKKAKTTPKTTAGNKRKASPDASPQKRNTPPAKKKFSAEQKRLLVDGTPEFAKRKSPADSASKRRRLGSSRNTAAGICAAAQGSGDGGTFARRSLRIADKIAEGMCMYV